MITDLQICLLLLIVSGTGSENHSESNQTFSCRMDNSSTVECNGRGVCIGGVCECDKRPHDDETIHGQFCEFDNFSCDRHNGQLCSGPDHGTCSYGVCQCRPGWVGAACDCRSTNETCIRRNSNEICSGHGTCECGTCRCYVGADGRFSGRYCEKCPTCRGLCEELKNCVQCQMYRTGPLAVPEEMCAKNCTTIITTGVDKIQAYEDYEEMDEHLCTFYDDVGCRFQFVYTYVQ